MTRTLRDVMSPASVCVAATEPVSAAAKAMREHGIGAVLVLATGTPVGLVSVGDLALEKDRHSALSGISAAPPNI